MSTAQDTAQNTIRALLEGLSRSCVGVLSLGLTAWHLISPAFGNHCRFYPSCSVYAKEALQKHGVVRGGWLSTKRVCRCNSLFEGGIDPVP